MSVIVTEWWYNTSRSPAVQCCLSLRVSPHFLTSSALLSLPSSLMCSPTPPPPLHSSAWFIFPVTASVPCDLYVYGHYWRWVIHFRFSPLLRLPPSLFWQSPGVLQGISITLFLFNHSLSLPHMAPLLGRQKEVSLMRCLLFYFITVESHYAAQTKHFHNLFI